MDNGLEVSDMVIISELMQREVADFRSTMEIAMALQLGSHKCD